MGRARMDRLPSSPSWRGQLRERHGDFFKDAGCASYPEANRFTRLMLLDRVLDGLDGVPTFISDFLAVHEEDEIPGKYARTSGRAADARRPHPNAADLFFSASRAHLAPYVSHRVHAVRGAKAHSETTRGAFALTLLAGLPEFPERHVRNNSVEGLRGFRVVAEVALRQIGGVALASAIEEAVRHGVQDCVSECGLGKQTKQDPQSLPWALGNLRARRTSCLGPGGRPF